MNKKIISLEETSMIQKEKIRLKTVTVIQKADLSMLEDIVPLFDAYRQFYKQSSDIEGARKFLKERLEKNESVIFLAFSGKKAVGFTQLYPSFSSVSMKRLWILNDLFVDPENRKFGVAKNLMETARVFAQETQSKGLTLHTAIDNIPAQRLYESLGYERENDFYGYYLIFSKNT